MSKTQEELRNCVTAIREQMREAERQAGREPGSTLLCAACKTQPPEVIRLAAALDIDRFGENRVQELVCNWEAEAYGEKPVDFIGHLQTNKVRQVVGRAALIQSVDSLRLMECIQREAEKQSVRQDILLEVNIGEETSKSGLLPRELEPLLAAAGGFSALRVRGIMSIPPKAMEIHGNVQYFQRLFQLFIDIKQKKYDNVGMDFLSMGMSGDYCDAIGAGAGIIRVGSAIFGARPDRNIR